MNGTVAVRFPINFACVQLLCLLAAACSQNPPDQLVSTTPPRHADTQHEVVTAPGAANDQQAMSRAGQPSKVDPPVDQSETGNISGEQQAVVPVPQPASWKHLDDANRDGWSSEAVADQAQSIVKKIVSQAYGAEAEDRGSTGTYVDDAFRATPLVPDQLETVTGGQALTVQRASGLNDVVMTEVGKANWHAYLREVKKPWRAASDLQTEVKLFHVMRRDQIVETKQYVVVSGVVEQQRVEQHATWKIDWKQAGSDAMRMAALRLEAFEIARSPSPQPWFQDITAAVMNSSDCYQPQFLRGMNHWLQRTQDLRYFSPLGNPGLAIGDVNGDGLEDLYVCQEAGLPNRLFLKQPDGTVREASAAWNVDWLESSRSALLIDLDNDGDQDLAVAILGGLAVASNEGDSFQLRSVLPTDDDTTTLTAADYDSDGDLDLYVCVDYPNDYFSESKEISVLGGVANRVYHDANNAGRNALFRNELQRDSGSGEAWQFAEQTEATGLAVNNRRFSWAASWEDFDNDGDVDLYVANDFGRNNLYRNDEGHFQDVAAEYQAEDSASGMSVAWGDIDRDGWMDVYIANMFSSAGQRVTLQPEFQPDASAPIKQRLRRFSRGSTLLRNDSGTSFQDVSERLNVTVGRWAWSSNFVDINNDGWQDIVAANGYITTDDTSDL